MTPCCSLSLCFSISSSLGLLSCCDVLNSADRLTGAQDSVVNKQKPCWPVCAICRYSSLCVCEIERESWHYHSSDIAFSFSQSFSSLIRTLLGQWAPLNSAQRCRLLVWIHTHKPTHTHRHPQAHRWLLLFSFTPWFPLLFPRITVWWQGGSAAVWAVCIWRV